ncbi:hypothetical protein [Croceiramulus getboli]|nr:hypothetical protein P8624_09910 [Flavobacteriaceae bacterium YJPT1-3]
MKAHLKKLAPHLLVILGFVIVSLLYFSPVLQGKKIYQSDIAWYMGMAKEQIDFRETTGEEPYWTDAAYAGMPTYTLGAKYPHNYIKQLDLSLRFLPRPADYLFLYFFSFYVLMLVLKMNWRYAALGALAFGFSTYLIVILGVGHNAKAHAVGYMPLVLSGILLTFRRYYLWGFLLTAVSLALEIVANHVQMTYYLMLLVMVLGIAYAIDAYRKKVLPHYFKSLGILFLAAGFAVATNATQLMATQEYAQFSTRGASDLTINPDGTPKEQSTGLDKEYINQYSYGLSETLNLFVAKLYGGSNNEPFKKDSAFAKYLQAQGVPASELERVYDQFSLYYWGDQPGVSGPAYLGAVVVFLFVLGLFLVKGRLKWWLVGGSILTLSLSYGSNLSWFTDLWVDHFPLYNKFRAVTSIQVIVELCVPVLAIFGLYKILQPVGRKEDKIKALRNTGFITGGLALVLLIFKGLFFDYSGGNDAFYIQNYGMALMDAIRADRSAILTNELLKTLLLIGLMIGILWAFLEEKLKESRVLLMVGVLILFDLVSVARTYVNTEDFVNARMMDRPFPETAADQEIRKDTTRYRVYEERAGITNSRSSYYHSSIGGYSAAKPQRIQDIADFYLYQGKQQPLNFLNVKYIIQETEEGTRVVQNPQANGNAWFVNNVQVVDSQNEELLALDKINTKQTAVVHREYADYVSQKMFPEDSTATIALIEHQPNYLKYRSSARGERLAIFSEAYYPEGWNAYVDGELKTHFRADYMLRAMMIPAGTHLIEFKFEPAVIEKGSRFTLLANLLLGVILIGGLVWTFRKQKDGSES